MKRSERGQGKGQQRKGQQRKGAGKGGGGKGRAKSKGRGGR